MQPIYMYAIPSAYITRRTWELSFVILSQFFNQLSCSDGEAERDRWGSFPNIHSSLLLIFVGYMESKNPSVYIYLFTSWKPSLLMCLNRLTREALIIIKESCTNIHRQKLKSWKNCYQGDIKQTDDWSVTSFCVSIYIHLKNERNAKWKHA